MNDWIDGQPPINLRGPCMFEMFYGEDHIERRVMDVQEYTPNNDLFWDDHVPLSRAKVISYRPLEWPKGKEQK